MSKTFKAENIMTSVTRATKKTVVFSQERRRERKQETRMVRHEMQQWELDRLDRTFGGK